MIVVLSLVSSGCLLSGGDLSDAEDAASNDTADMVQSPNDTGADAGTDATTPRRDLGPPTTLVVTTTDDEDDGRCDASHCSLREASLEAAERDGGAITFAFDRPPENEGYVIELGSTLFVPANTSVSADREGALAVEITTSGNSDLIQLDGSGASLSGLRLSAESSVQLIRIAAPEARVIDCDLAGGRVGVAVLAAAELEGLVITGASDAAVVFDSAEGGVIRGSLIGVSEGVPGPNGIGIAVSGGSATIGATDARNTIVFSNEHGIQVGGGADVTLLGNYIGQSDSGDSGPNAGAGMVVQDGGKITVGGLGCDWPCNVFANNGQEGIRVTVADEVEIAGSVFTASQQADVDCIRIGAVPQALIGSPQPLEVPVFCDGPCNVVTGCTGFGLSSDADRTRVMGNYFGAVGDGAQSGLPNLGRGMSIHNAAEIRGNVVGGSGRETILVAGDGDVDIVGNHVGVRADGATCAPMPQTNARQSGILIDKSSGLTAVEQNVIGCIQSDPATNVAYGIHVAGSNLGSFMITQNSLGVGPSDGPLLPISSSCIGIFGGGGQLAGNVARACGRHGLLVSTLQPVTSTDDQFSTENAPPVQVTEGAGHRLERPTLHATAGAAVLVLGDSNVMLDIDDADMTVDNATPRFVQLVPSTGPGPHFGMGGPFLTMVTDVGNILMSGLGTLGESTIDVYAGSDRTASSRIGTCSTRPDRSFDCTVSTSPLDTHLHLFERAKVVRVEVTAMTSQLTLNLGSQSTIVNREGRGSGDFLAAAMTAFGLPHEILPSGACTNPCANVALGERANIRVGTMTAPVLGSIISPETSFEASIP